MAAAARRGQGKMKEGCRSQEEPLLLLLIAAVVMVVG